MKYCIFVFRSKEGLRITEFSEDTSLSKHYEYSNKKLWLSKLRLCLSKHALFSTPIGPSVHSFLTRFTLFLKKFWVQKFIFQDFVTQIRILKESKLDYIYLLTWSRNFSFC